jgi:hypothetical protein
LAQTAWVVDIEGPNTQEWVQQWDFHTAPQAKWTIQKQSDGFYTIRSEYGSKLYVGVSDINIGVDNIKLYASISDATRWSVYQNAAGELVFDPKIAPGRLLYAPNASTGTQLRLAFGNVIGSYSKWKTSKYYAQVNVFYDNGFSARYGSAGTPSTKLSGLMTGGVHTAFFNTFGLNLLFNTPELYNSIADQCKTLQGLGINATTIEQVCPGGSGHVCGSSHPQSGGASRMCTSAFEMYSHFISVHPGSSNTVSMLFSGNKLTDGNGNYRWYSNGIAVNGIVSPASVYYTYMTSTVLHEMSHSFGAPDHYHLPNVDGNGQCKNKSVCSDCGDIKRPKGCLMGEPSYAGQPFENMPEELWCSGCKADIIAYLNANCL